MACNHERLRTTYEVHRVAQAELGRLFACWEELERRWLGAWCPWFARIYSSRTEQRIDRLPRNTKNKDPTPKL